MPQLLGPITCRFCLLYRYPIEACSNPHVEGDNSLDRSSIPLRGLLKISFPMSQMAKLQVVFCPLLLQVQSICLCRAKSVIFCEFHRVYCWTNMDIVHPFPVCLFIRTNSCYSATTRRGEILHLKCLVLFSKLHHKPHQLKVARMLQNYYPIVPSPAD